MRRFAIFLAVSALLATGVMAYEAQAVVINGQQMMSLNAFGESFGAVIDYDCTRDGISISLCSRTVVMVPYSNTAWIDGVPCTLATPVVIIDDVTYVPLNFLCTAFNLNYNCPSNCAPVVINPVTQQCVTLIIDTGWCSFPHIWCYNFSCCHYRNFYCGHGGCGFRPFCGGGHHFGPSFGGGHFGAPHFGGGRFHGDPPHVNGSIHRMPGGSFHGGFGGGFHGNSSGLGGSFHSNPGGSFHNNPGGGFHNNPGSSFRGGLSGGYHSGGISRGSIGGGMHGGGGFGGGMHGGGGSHGGGGHGGGHGR